MGYETHLIAFWYNDNFCTCVSFIDQDLVALAKSQVPHGRPFLIVDKSVLDTAVDGDLNTIQLDWSNPDGYGEGPEVAV